MMNPLIKLSGSFKNLERDIHTKKSPKIMKNGARPEIRTLIKNIELDLSYCPPSAIRQSIERTASDDSPTTAKVPKKSVSS
jgi:hypothetical protein